MYFFFDYIYYRITQVFFKKDGRTGATAITLIAIMQSLLLWIFIQLIINQCLSVDVRALYSRYIGYGGGVIFLILFFINYRKYNGSYNRFKFYWKGENRRTRLIKGLLVMLSLPLPIVLWLLILGTKSS